MDKLQSIADHIYNLFIACLSENELNDSMSYNQFVSNVEMAMTLAELYIQLDERIDKKNQFQLLENLSDDLDNKDK